jgi:heme exporter protein CcmD
MDLSAPHADFVAAAYVISALVLFGLAAVILVRDRKLRAEADALDRQRPKDVP